MDFTIRAAAKDDCKDMARMIMESAIYGNFSNKVKTTSEDLERDGFSQNPLFHCFVVEVSCLCVVGMALYYTYSTWRGRCIHLESLYMMQDFRGGMFYSLKDATKNQCSRLELIVGDWNTRAQQFYALKGGSDITDGEGWHLLRFDGNNLDLLASEALSV
uniref:Spermidine/spermine N1-acetyltransferase family member 2b n=1 Tax=Gouania willdenowi TaxID=441366 RepID=A0A8C5G8B8_GOUWI